MQVRVVHVASVRRVLRRRELLVLLPLHGAVDEVSEHAGSGQAFGKLRFGARAKPNGNGVLRGNAAEIAVAPVLRRARLAGSHLAARGHGLRAGAVGEHALHDLRGGRGDLGLERFLARGVGLVDRLALAVRDLRDGLGVARRAAVGDGGVGLRHLLRGHLGGAQGERLVLGQFGLDAHAGGRLDQLVHADVLGQADEAGVRGHGERARDGARAVRMAVVVLELVAVDVRRRGAVDHGLRRDAVFQRADERERLERRAG